MSAKSCRNGFCMVALALARWHAEEKTWGTQDLLNGSIQSNPEVQAARSPFESGERLSQVGILPEPTASYTNFGVGHPVSRLTGGYRPSKSLSFPCELQIGPVRQT